MMYATIKGVKDADVTAVSYSGPVSGSLAGEDFEYLVRDTSEGVRVDVMGLKPGTYTLTVTIFLTQLVRHVVKQVMRQSVRRYRKERHITARVILIRVFSSYLLRIIYH